MKNSFGFSHILVLLVLLFAAAGLVAVFLSSSKNFPGQMAGKSDQKLTVKLQAQYNNPFDKSSQYANPFSQYKNPFVVAK